MKKILVVVLSVFATVCGANAQKLVSTKLNNGMTVYVYEDPAQHDVFGEVVVRTGSYNDPEQYTGLAHYLEHVMFKGTQRIGALDWTAEKPIYEQIIAKYDEMAETSDPAAKEAIAKEINRLTIEEGKISISQEYSNLIESIGGNNLNAGTSFDQTVYYNTFPAPQMAKWMAVASERFINPVFRAFQSELETVYEEYNMYSDDPDNQVQQFMLGKAFEGTPYARDVIGLGEHLKNPRLSQLIKYYEDWYVPENMALVVVGNIDAQTVLRTAASTFGRLKPKAVPERKQYPEFAVKGRTAYSTRIANYPSLFMIFNGVKSGDPDEYALEICSELLNNTASTGLLDKLTIEGDVMGAGAGMLSLVNQGRFLIQAIPYYDKNQQIYDSGKKVEKLMKNAISALKNGDFSQSTLDAIKVAICRDYDLSFESNSGKVNVLASSFIEGRDLNEAMAYKDRICAVTVDDIKRVAAKYLNDNYIVIDNEIGRPSSKNTKIKKPGYDPIDPPVGKSSAYATWFKGRQAPTAELSFVDFASVKQKQVNSYSRLYYSQIPENDVFTLVLKYGANSKLFPKLSEAADLMNSAGVRGQYESNELKETFAELGATYNIGSNDEYLYVTLRGYESNLQAACILLTRLILMPSLDEKQMDNVIGSLYTDRVTRKKNINIIADALDSYVKYGKESSYKTELTDKEIVELDINSLTGEVLKASKYAAEIYYSGRLPFETVYDILSKNLPLVEGENPSSSPRIVPMETYDENKVFFVSNTDAKQAQINFYVPIGDYDKSQELKRMAFNQYFSGGFNGLVMQEIREKNSMAYTAYGSATSRGLPGSKTYLTGYIGTQNDKALGAVELFYELLENMPQHPETIDNIKNSIKESLQTQKPSPRNLGQSVSAWEKMGYTEDPAKELAAQVDSLTFDDIVDFYNTYIKGKPVAISIVADPRDVNSKDFAKFGKVVKLSDKDLFNDKDVMFQ